MYTTMVEVGWIEFKINEQYEIHLLLLYFDVLSNYEKGPGQLFILKTYIDMILYMFLFKYM